MTPSRPRLHRRPPPPPPTLVLLLLLQFLTIFFLLLPRHSSLSLSLALPARSSSSLRLSLSPDTLQPDSTTISVLYLDKIFNSYVRLVWQRNVRLGRRARKRGNFSLGAQARRLRCLLVCRPTFLSRWSNNNLPRSTFRRPMTQEYIPSAVRSMLQT